MLRCRPTPRAATRPPRRGTARRAPTRAARCSGLTHACAAARVFEHMRTRPEPREAARPPRGSRGLVSGAREPAQVVGEAVAVDLLEQRQQLAAQLAARRPLRRRVLEVRHAVRVRIAARGRGEGGCGGAVGGGGGGGRRLWRWCQRRRCRRWQEVASGVGARVDVVLRVRQHRPPDLHVVDDGRRRHARERQEAAALHHVAHHVLLHVASVVAEEDGRRARARHLAGVRLEADAPAVARLLDRAVRSADAVTLGGGSC